MPDYGIPGAAWSDEPLAPTTRPGAAAGRSSQLLRQRRRTTTTTSSQDSYFARVEHDLRPTVTAAISSSATTRRTATAVISTIQNVAGLRPGDRPGDGRAAGQRARERDHLEPDQRRRRSPGPAAPRHALSRGRSSSRASRSSRRRSTGVGTRAPVDIYAPDIHDDPVTGMRVAPHRRLQRRARTDTAAVYGLRHRRHRAAPPGHRRPAGRALRHRASGAVDAAGVDHDRCRRRGHARERQGRRCSTS